MAPRGTGQHLDLRLRQRQASGMVHLLELKQDGRLEEHRDGSQNGSQGLEIKTHGRE